MKISELKIKSWKLNNREIVFVGDSRSDLKAAKNHNLTFIARVSSVSNSLIKEKYTLKDLNKLDEIILIINKNDSNNNLR